MAGMNHRLTKLYHRKGDFDGYTIYGFLYQSEGELKKGWNITSSALTGSVNHYWLEDGEFHAVGTHLMMPPTGENFINIGEVVPVEQPEKTAILSAVKQWTAEYHDKILAEF